MLLNYSNYSDSEDDADGNVASVTYKESKDTGTVKIGSKTMILMM